MFADLRFLKIVDEIPTEYTISQFIEDYPEEESNLLSYGLPNQNILKKYDVYPLITTEKPKGDVVEESTPIKVNDEWHQTWKVREYTEEEKLLLQIDTDFSPTPCDAGCN